MKNRIVILGAGLAGLSAANRLKKGYRLVEKDERPGGLARTDNRDGFLFDKTGHWLHLRNPEIKSFVEKTLAGCTIEHERHASIFSNKVFTPYPFQANLHGLPLKITVECLMGFIGSRIIRRESGSRSFEDWINSTFGPGIANHFLLPYNRKIWTLHPSQLSAGFCEKYIPIPSMKEIILGSFGLSREAMGYNARFNYPADGGIESLTKGISSTLAIPPECGLQPVSIDWKRRVALFNDGSETKYPAIVSTIPMPELVRLLKKPPLEIIIAAKKLRATTVTYFNIAAKSHGPNKFSWIYFPEKDFEFYRIGSYSACHPGMAPEGMASFYVEYSHINEINREAVLAKCLSQMAEAGLINSIHDVLFTECKSIHPAYVICDMDHDSAVRTINDFLRREKIVTAGRYGTWGYSAMEDAIVEGFGAADLVKSTGLR